MDVVPVTAHVLLPGSGTTRIDTPDSAGLSLLGDMDIRGLWSLDDWTPAATSTLISHWGASGNRSWTLSVNNTSNLVLTWTVGGTTVITKVSTAATGFTDGTPHWVRVVHDVDNGATGNDVLFYTSNDPVTTAPGSVSWTQLGTTVTTAATTSHFNSTTLIAIGAQNVGTLTLMTGKAYYAELRSSIAGTIVGSPDFRDATQITTPNSVFTDGQGNAWTLQTAANWVNEGTGASTLAGVTSAGTGVYTPAAITGTGASTLAGVTSAGTGTFTGSSPPPSGGGARMGTGRAIRKPPRLSVVRRRR